MSFGEQIKANIKSQIEGFIGEGTFVDQLVSTALSSRIMGINRCIQLSAPAKGAKYFVMNNFFVVLKEVSYSETDLDAYYDYLDAHGLDDFDMSYDEYRATVANQNNSNVVNYKVYSCDRIGAAMIKCVNNGYTLVSLETQENIEEIVEVINDLNENEDMTIDRLKEEFPSMLKEALQPYVSGGLIFN